MFSHWCMNFIFVWVTPAFFMVLYEYDTPRYNLWSRAIPYILLLSLPFTGVYYLIYPTIRPFALYGYITIIATYMMCRVYWVNLPKAVSISAIACVLSSYYWELPWLVRNAVLVGYENDWILHLLGLVFLWFLVKFVGFKKTWGVAGRLLAVLALSTWYMIFTGIPPGASSARMWNGWGFMAIRTMSTATVMLSLDLEKQGGHGAVRRTSEKRSTQ